MNAIIKAGLAEHDRLVFALLRGMGLPVATVTPSGYKRRIEGKELASQALAHR